MQYLCHEEELKEWRFNGFAKAVGGGGGGGRLHDVNDTRARKRTDDACGDAVLERFPHNTGPEVRYSG